MAMDDGLTSTRETKRSSGGIMRLVLGALIVLEMLMIKIAWLPRPTLKGAYKRCWFWKLISSKIAGFVASLLFLCVHIISYIPCEVLIHSDVY